MTPTYRVDDPLARPKRSMVVAAVLLTGVLTGSIFALLLYRGLAVPEPTRVLVVRADSTWDGAELTVEGEPPLDHRSVTHVEKLGNYVVPFFLWPGKYTLRVKNQGVEVFTRHFDLTSTQTDEIDLTRVIGPAPTTNPSTAPS